MPKAKSKSSTKTVSGGKKQIHSEAQKEAVKRAREVIKRFKEKIGGGDVEKRVGMTHKEADAVMAAWRDRVDSVKK